MDEVCLFDKRISHIAKYTGYIIYPYFIKYLFQ